MKMNKLTVALFLLPAVCVSAADGTHGRKVYECRYVQTPPAGVSGWSQSDLVRSGEGRESRFVPYNSKAAQGLWLDATTSRDVAPGAAEKARETAFHMVYDEEGWHIYFECREPDLQDFLDRGKDISLEIFFCPGMERVPYYQLIVRQLAGKVTFYDWAMPHRYYRSLKGRARIESRPIDGGVATAMFVPWDVLYDRLPLNGEHWRFSVMRWGGASMTWGGKVHDTGNFGLVKFEVPPAGVAEAVRKRMCRSAWLAFSKSSHEAEEFWNDEKIGDQAFYGAALEPVIRKYRELGESLGMAGTVTAAALDEAGPVVAEWMEFPYVVSELRAAYLTEKHFAAERP